MGFNLCSAWVVYLILTPQLQSIRVAWWLRVGPLRMATELLKSLVAMKEDPKCTRKVCYGRSWWRTILPSDNDKAWQQWSFGISAKLSLPLWVQDIWLGSTINSVELFQPIFERNVVLSVVARVTDRDVVSASRNKVNTSVTLLLCYLHTIVKDMYYSFQINCFSFPMLSWWKSSTVITAPQWSKTMGFDHIINHHSSIFGYNRAFPLIHRGDKLDLSSTHFSPLPCLLNLVFIIHHCSLWQDSKSIYAIQYNKAMYRATH